MAVDPARGLRELARGLIELHPGEAARQLEVTHIDETVRLLETLPTAATAGVLERLVPDVGARVLERMNERALVPLLTALDPSHAAPLLARMDEAARTRLLTLLDPAAARELRELASYPKDTAGSLMDPRVLAVRPETTVRETLARLRGFRDRKLRRVFLIDEQGRLIGSVQLQELAVADPAEHMSQLEPEAAVSVRATAGVEDVMEVLERHGIGTLPVVDFGDRLIGVIRHDALIDAARQEATADLQTMVGASREERALSKVSLAVRKRLPWLEVNLGTAFLAAAVVGLFEETIARNTALAVLLPVVAGQSGNTGAQALAVTMRGLALREVRTRHWLRVALKEVRVAFFNGIAISLTTALFVYLWSRSAGLALIIGVSMVLSMVAAGLSGAVIPMLLTALGQDPAQASSIILTTVTDVAGFLSFLGIATLMASML